MYKYEHEITFTDGSVQYLQSETNHLSSIDKEFLKETGVDFSTIKTTLTYKITN